MSLMLKYLYKSIRESRLQIFLIIVSFALVSLIIYTNLNANEVIRVSYTENIEKKYGNTDLIITKKNLTRNPYFKKSDVDLDKIDIFKKNEVLTIPASVDNKNVEKDIMIKGGNLESLVDSKLLNLHTDDKVKWDDDSVVISSKTAEKYNVIVNDLLEITLFNVKIEMKVTAIAENSGLLDSIENPFIILMSEEKLQQYINKRDKISEVYLTTSKNVNQNIVSKEIQKRNNNLVLKETFNAETLNVLISNINAILFFSLVLVCYLSAVVTTSLYKYIIDKRISVFGTFRSIGASRKDIIYLMLFENVTYGFFGGIIGIFLAILVSKVFYTNLFGTLVNLSTMESSLNLRTILLSFVFIVAWSLVVSIFEIFKISRISIKENIFRKNDTAKKSNNKKTILGAVLLLASVGVGLGDSLTSKIISFVLILLGFLFIVDFIIKLAGRFLIICSKFISKKVFFPIKSIYTNKVTSKNIVIFIISIGLSISIFSIMSSIENLFNQVINTSQFDIIVGGGTKTKDKYTNLSNSDSISDVGYIYKVDAKLYNKKNVKDVSILGRERKDKFEHFLKNPIKYDDYQVNKLGYDEILIDKKIAEKLKLDINDKVEIEFNDKKHSLKYVGSMNSFNFSSIRNVVIVKKSFFIDNISDAPSTIYINSSESVNKTFKEVKNYFSDTHESVWTKTEYFKEQKDQNDSLMRIVALSLILGVVVGIFGVINNLVINYISRKKEFSVLLSTAMNRGQLKKYVFIEISVSLALIMVLSVLFSIILIVGISEVLQSADLYVKLLFPVNETIFLMILVSVIMFLLYIVPSNLIEEMNIYEELRKE